MTDTDENPSSPSVVPPEDHELIPSWKPLWWVLGITASMIVLGELILEFGMNALEVVFDVLEHVYLVLIEAPEEILEDYIEEWLENHFPNDASRYSEMVTAIGLTPVKILVGIVLLKNLWMYSKHHFLPRLLRWIRRHYLSVKLAYQILPWHYKILVGVLVLGGLVILL
mgnify:CR=1 FL=1